MNQAERETRRRKRILEHARITRNLIKTCRYFGVSRSTFYLWRRAYQAQGDAGLIKKKPIPHQMPNQTPPEVVEKILHLRRTYPLGPIRIIWYLERYHAIRISGAACIGSSGAMDLTDCPVKWDVAPSTQSVTTSRFPAITYR